MTRDIKLMHKNGARNAKKKKSEKWAENARKMQINGEYFLHFEISRTHDRLLGINSLHLI